MENIPAPDPKAEELRLKISSVAFPAFNQSGFGGVSADDLCTELKISKKTLYKVFRSKEEILEHALLRLFDETSRKLNAALDTRLSPKETLQLLALEYVRFNAIFSPKLAEELKEILPHLNERLHRYRKEQFQKVLSQRLKDFRSREWVEYPSPTKSFSVAFFQMVDGIRDLPEEMILAMINVMQKGIAAKSKDKKKK